MERWKEWEGKKVFIILKNKRNYSGIVKSVDNNSITSWITITTRSGNNIVFSIDEIEVMQEEQ